MDLDHIDVDFITKKQKEAEKRFSNLSTEEWKWLRRKAKTDLFFLCFGVLRYKKLSEGLHGHLCSWLKLTINEQFREILLPRGHYKTTVVTKGDGVQIALTDDNGDQPWPRNLGPNCRICLIHENHELGAARFLEEIANHFLGNEVLMGLFPELVPDPKQQRINKLELELPRTELWSEPTFDTMGVGGRSQGRHYNYLKADDLIGDKARDSATEMMRAKEWFDNIQSFFSSFAIDHMDICGTRWAFDDLYSHVHKTYGEQLKKYIRAVEELNDQGNRVAIFPEEFPLEKLNIIRKNRRVWSAQYINDPKEGAAEFDPSWKRHYYWRGSRELVIFQGNAGLNNVVKLDDLDIVILIDPAMSGKSGFLVTGNDSKNRIFLLDAQKKDWKPPQLVDYLFRSVMRWHPRVVGIEEVLFSGLFLSWLPREMSLRNIRFNIVPVKTSQKKKEVRVRGLANYFSAGQVFWPESFEEFTEEFERFGGTDDIHLLDALAHGPQIWAPGLSKETWDRYKKLEQEVLNERDNLTGYSAMY